ncbi:MAG: hypothetical protein L3J07_02045 [Candidatus Magasanikbacteria bacterium]|nr:hypothetical protein [Candidatus Magasanikbacteria bacterium]
MPETKRQSEFDTQTPENSELEKAKVEFLENLEKGYLHFALQIKNRSDIPEDEIVEVVQNRFLEKLKEKYNNEISKIKEIFNLSKEFLESFEVVEAAKIGFLKTLEIGDLYNISKIENEYNIPKEFLESFEVVEAAKIGLSKTLKTGILYDALEIKDKFDIPEDEINEVVKIEFLRMMKEGKIDDVINIRDRFNIPENEIIEVAKNGFFENLKNGQINNTLKIKCVFKLSEEFFESAEALEAAKNGFLEMLKEGWVDEALRIKKIFKLSEEFLKSTEVLEVVKNEFLENLEVGLIISALEIKDKFNLPPETTKVFNKAYNTFGDNLTYNIYLECELILNGEISDELKEFGVSVSGEAGINQLNVKIREYGHNIIHEQEFDWENMLDSQIKRTAFQSSVQYTNSEWGSDDEEEFEKIVRTYLNVKQEIQPLSFEYTNSDILKIKKIKQVDTETFEYSEQFLSSYNNLLESLKKGIEYAKKKEYGIREIIGKLEEGLVSLVSSLEEKKGEYKKQIQETKDEKEREKIERALKNLERKIREISDINLKSIQNPIELFENLRSFKDKRTNELLKDLMIYIGVYKNENIQNKKLSELDTNKPTTQDISWVMNTIQHIVLQETVEPYFTKEHFDPDEKLKPKQRKKKEKELQKKIRKLLNTSTLNEEMKKMKGDASKDTVNMKFIPQRNLLTEFSGHFSDSCWASIYDSILKKFPNFISVAMVHNPDHPKYEKIAGGCFLIEAKAKNGDDLLIIRGLNPQENLINQLSPEDFYKNFTEYFKEIAEKQGRKLAIVIDDHSGGSGTNRPVLFSFLNKLRSSLKKVKLASDEETEFNGYNIVNDCYLVE